MKHSRLQLHSVVLLPVEEFADEDGTIGREGVQFALPPGLDEVDVAAFLDGLFGEGDTVPAEVAAGAVQEFILDGNIGTLAGPALIEVVGGEGGPTVAIGGLSVAGAVNINSNANIDVTGSSTVVGIGAASGAPSVAEQLGFSGFGAASGEPQPGGPITIVNDGDINATRTPGPPTFAPLAGIFAQSGNGSSPWMSCLTKISGNLGNLSQLSTPA